MGSNFSCRIMKTDVGLKIIALVFFLAAGQPVLADEDAGKDAYVDSLMSIVRPMRDRGRLVPAAQEFMDFLDREGFTDGKIIIPDRCPVDSVRALTWYWAGEWYYDSQNYATSLDYALKSMALLSSKVTSPVLKADCSNLASIVYFRLSDFVNALEYSKMSLSIAREFADRDRMSYALNTIAGISLASRQPEEGEKYVLEAIKICEEQHDSVKLSVRLGMASEIYHAMGRDEESLEYARRGYDVSMQLGSPDKAAVRLVQMAAASNSLGRLEEAEKCLREAIPVLEQCGNLQSWAIAGNQMGDIMLEKGDSASAACYFEKSLKVFESRGDAYNMSHSHYGLGRALMPADPSLAANHIMKYTQIRDSLYNSEMKRGLNEYHAIYGNDRLLEEMDHGRMIRRRLIVMGIALLLIMSGLLCIIFLRMRHARLSLERAMARITELENQTKEIHEDDKPAAGPDSGNEFLHRLTDIALEVITEGNVDYELIASRMCISRAHLNRKVKALAGCTTTDFILAIRISKAKELLRGTSLPVWEVAQRCGFSDNAYFSTMFKKTVGCTPVQFRNA